MWNKIELGILFPCATADERSCELEQTEREIHNTNNENLAIDDLLERGMFKYS